MASGGISTSRMANSKEGGPAQESAKEMYWLSSCASVRLRWLSKNSFRRDEGGNVALGELGLDGGADGVVIR